MIVSITPELGLEFVKNFAGGLGALEGDRFYAAARLGVPYLAITLYYPEGYVSYGEENGKFVPTVERNSLEGLRYVGSTEISTRGDKVQVSYYVYVANTATAVFIKVERPEWAVKATRRLYLEDTDWEKFYKYVILAKAAVEYVDRYVGWDKVSRLELQEAYTVFILFFRRHPEARLIIHTPAPWGHPAFSKRFFREEWGYDLAMDPVVLTELGLAMAGGGVVVSKKMERITCNTFPHHCHKLRPITNAVEVSRWGHPRVAAVNSLEELCKARSEIKREALEALGVDARGRLVISWARRVTRYKRPHFVLQLAQDVDRDVVYILGGRAHPEDSYGVEVMEKFRQLAGSMDNVYYFPQLDLDTMKKIIWASDIWLFTPFSGWEASGTSFMKAGINGVPSVTSRDGAVVEVVRDGVNGWLFGEDREKLMSIDDMEIDSREYREFRDKVIKAVDAYFDGSYWQVAYSAYKTFREYYTMDRLFKDYGYI